MQKYKDLFRRSIFTEKYKGAQNEKYFKDPDINILKLWQRKIENLIRKIAIAPERKGSIELTRYATKIISLFLLAIVQLHLNKLNKSLIQVLKCLYIHIMG